MAASTVSTPPRTELISIQYLRAVAALGVVVWHAQGQVGVPETQVLQAGIEIFFVISGYVMWRILNKRPVSPGVFLQKRLARIVPLYWLLTTFMVVLLLVAPHLLQSTRFDLPHVVASYLFVAWPNPVEAAGLKPVMIPGWTLNYEMAFYLMLTAALFLKARLRGAVVIGVLLVLTVLSVLPLPPIAAFYASPFMAELALGVGLAMVLPRVPEGWLRHGGLVFVTGCGLLLAGGSVIGPEAHGRLVFLALPATLIVAGLVAVEQAGRLPSIPILKAIGDASYPLYMIHPVLLSATAQGLRLTGVEMAPWLYVTFALVVTSVVGWFAHLWLERPLIAAFKPRPRPSAPATRVLTVVANDARS
ncbi:acyltransferase family protein [Brevundimonas staleyi]|uniref:Acyltransferase family protein n=1 Tax=Brevundimonas staleyi TaxID=74326 RepID=A0ABW0FSF5_9CAUL